MKSRNSNDMQRTEHGSIAINAVDVTKQFGNKCALNALSLTIKKGTIHAILGPNGAGKTTFIKILSTLLKPTGGRAEVLGHDVVRDFGEVKKRISLAGQNASLDEELTGYENLFIFGRLLGLGIKASRDRAKELLRFFSLQDSAGSLVKNYSGGMRRRLDIAASIIRPPSVLFLDEPTTGLDPRGRNELWELIREIAKTGTTVLLTTQYLDEADQLADQITVIDNGRLVSAGTPDELKRAVGADVLHLSLLNGDEEMYRRAKALVESERSVHSAVSISKSGLAVAVDDAGDGMKVVQLLTDAGMHPEFFSLARPTLDEVFLSLTGKQTGGNDDGDKGKKNAPSSSEVADEPSDDGQVLDVDVCHGTGSALAGNRHSGVITGSMMLGWRSLLKIKHIPEQFTDVLITPVMFTFMFAFLLGGAIAGSVEDYLAFLVPGMLVQTLTFNSIYSAMNLHTDISKGIFDRLKTLPIWSASPFLGLFVGDCLRHVLSGSFLLLFSLFIGYELRAGGLHIIAALVLLTLFSLSLSWLFIIIALAVRSLSAVMSISWVLLMPLVFLSNIYAAPETMPAWLQRFVAYNPVAWQVDAVRGMLGGEILLPETGKALLGSLVIGSLLMPIAIWFYRRER